MPVWSVLCTGSKEKHSSGLYTTQMKKKMLVCFKHLTSMINIGPFYTAGSKISNSNNKKYCPCDLFYVLDQKRNILLVCTRLK